MSFLQEAEQKVSVSVGKIIQSSLVYESEPWGFETSQSFLNKVVIIETDLSARTVLQKVLAIEKELGRKRLNEGYASRQIDIDILYFNEISIDEPDLVIPHPGIAKRRFVLVPLAEVANSYIHPVLKMTHTDLLKQCADELKVWVYKMKNN